MSNVVFSTQSRQPVALSAIVCLLCVLTFSQSVPLSLGYEPTLADSDGEDVLRATERRLQAAYKRVQPASVQILYDKWYCGTGVIVSAEGHILTSSANCRRTVNEKLLKIRLSDGRLVDGQALGWSSELRAGVLKVDEPFSFAPVEFGVGANVRAGDPCIAVGFERHQQVDVDQQPSLSFGTVTIASGANWFESTCDMVPQGYGVFGLDGKLIGLQTGGGARAIHTNVEQVKKNWDALVAGRNVGLEDIRKSMPWIETCAAPTRAEWQVIDHAKQSTVRFSKGAFSGVIVSEDGHIITCAHHRLPPGQELTVYLFDGREADGVVLGSNWITDSGMIKIKDAGPWPFAKLGSSFSMNEGDPSIQVGYPATKDGQVLEVVRSTIARPINTLERRDPVDAVNMYTKGAPQVRGGFSGGGLFDAQGRVVGVMLQMHGNRQSFVRSELFKKNWDVLAAARSWDYVSWKNSRQAKRPARISESIGPIAQKTQNCTVNVLCDGKNRAVGSIVGSDGFILTKLSDLQGSLSCELADGRVFAATIHTRSEQHDLAILRIDAAQLPVLELSANSDLSPGTLLAAVLPRKKVRIGVVSLSPRPSPAAWGWLGCELEERDQGLTVKEKATENSDGILRSGDIILQINGHPIPDSTAFSKLHNSNGHIGNAGDQIDIEVQRNGRQLTLQCKLDPLYRGSDDHVSGVWWGFPSVAGADIELSARQCGCPLIDSNGDVVGIYVACRSIHGGYGLHHVLPAQIAREFVKSSLAIR